MERQSKWLLSVQVDDGALAMTQPVRHRIAQLLAPGCVPRSLNEGWKP